MSSSDFDVNIPVRKRDKMFHSLHFPKALELSKLLSNQYQKLKEEKNFQCIKFENVLKQFSIEMQTISNSQCIRFLQTNSLFFTKFDENLTPSQIIHGFFHWFSSVPLPFLNEWTFAPNMEEFKEETVGIFIQVMLNSILVFLSGHPHVNSSDFQEALVQFSCLFEKSLNNLRKEDTMDESLCICFSCCSYAERNNSQLARYFKCQNCAFWFHTNCCFVVSAKAELCDSCFSEKNSNVNKRGKKRSLEKEEADSDLDEDHTAKKEKEMKTTQKKDFSELVERINQLEEKHKKDKEELWAKMNHQEATELKQLKKEMESYLSKVKEEMNTFKLALEHSQGLSFLAVKDDFQILNLEIEKLKQSAFFSSKIDVQFHAFKVEMLKLKERIEEKSFQLQPNLEIKQAFEDILKNQISITSQSFYQALDIQKRQMEELAMKVQEMDNLSLGGLKKEFQEFKHFNENQSLREVLDVQKKQVKELSNKVEELEKLSVTDLKSVKHELKESNIEIFILKEKFKEQVSNEALQHSVEKLEKESKAYEERQRACIRDISSLIQFLRVKIDEVSKQIQKI